MAQFGDTETPKCMTVTVCFDYCENRTHLI